MLATAAGQQHRAQSTPGACLVLTWPFTRAFLVICMCWLWLVIFPER